MDRNPSFNRPPLWAISFENGNGSKEALPPTVSLRQAFNERNNIPMDNLSSTGNNDDIDNLDNNYFDTVDLDTNGPQRQDSIVYHANRVHSIHRNRVLNSQSNNIVQCVDARTGLTNGKKFATNKGRGDMADSIENHANLIVSKMEQDPDLMEDSPEAEELRREALRDMPQCLTLKRCVKVKLSKSVSQKSKRKPLSCYKMFKYQMSIAVSKLKLNIKSLAYSLELWYGTVKQIEGNFGSGVASFFKFLRWMFVMDLLIAVISFCFIVLPEITFSTRKSTLIESFNWKDIFSGEGYLTDTFIYYGFYSNQSVSLSALNYSMSDAYFFTMVSLYLSSFAVLSISVAGLYRRSFIETEGGLKNVYAHKIFCGWDYNIANEDAARLKSHAIYYELKELLFDDMRETIKDSCIVIFWTTMMQIMMNILILISLFGAGYVMYFLLEKSTNEQWPSVYTAMAVNVIMTVLPIIYSWVIKYEGYKNPKRVLYLTLIRTFILGFVMIGVLVSFWLKNPDNECWETSLGQEIYRLILFDFLFSGVLLPIITVIYYQFCRLFNKDHIHFDIAHYSMQIIYNQTLFWVGFFFSPFLAVIVVFKLFLTWYIRKLIVLKCCKPSSKTWRAAQTTTWFLVMTFLSLLLVLGVLGYIVTYMPTTSCGPFRSYDYIYEIVTLGMFNLRKDNNIWKILLFITKPGFIALVLIALCVRVYYLRAKAHAQRGIVAMYREMLMWESRDKEFLLQNISHVTNGQWQYKLQEGRELDPIISLQNMPKYKRGSEGDVILRDSSSQLFVTPSSSSSGPTSAMSMSYEIDDPLYSQYKKFS